MGFPSPSESQLNRSPLLMDSAASVSGRDHIILMPREDVASTSFCPRPDQESLPYSNRPSTITLPSSAETIPASPIPNARSSSFRRRHHESRGRRSPLNSAIWISVEVIVNLSQIVAAIVVLSLSRNEHPKAPLFEWVIGYTIGCFATLPHLYWRYIHRNSTSPDQRQQRLAQNAVSNTSELSPYATTSITSGPEIETSNRNAAENVIAANPRVNALFDHFKMAIDCFFAVWFVVGNVWIFGRHSSLSDSPNVYRLCLVFLTFSCIGYAMPFILCALICCCLPCIISVMGLREEGSHNRGATSELINALPTYKFKIKKRRGGMGGDTNTGGQNDGGMLAAGTDKERMISGEDAVCCICLTKYANNDELRELPCEHCFHKVCVDKWLKINALCPLCKSEIVSSSTSELCENNQSIDNV